MAERSHTHVYSRSALTVWRAVPLCCNAMLAQRMLAQANARATPPHALNITHSPALIQAPDHHALSDIGLETQTMKPAIRGACGTCLQTL